MPTLLIGSVVYTAYLISRKYVESGGEQAAENGLGEAVHREIGPNSLKEDEKRTTIAEYAKQSDIPLRQAFHQYYSIATKISDVNHTTSLDTPVRKQKNYSPHLYVGDQTFDMRSATLSDMKQYGWEAECVTDHLRYPTIQRKEFVLLHPFIPYPITVYCQNDKIKEVILDAIEYQNEDFSNVTINKHLRIGMSEEEVLKYFENSCEPLDIVESKIDEHKLLLYRRKDIIYMFNVDKEREVKYISVSLD